MKQFLFFFLISISIFAQDFSSIKTKTDTYSGLLTAEKLAQNIKRDFTNNEDKVKAAFCWITKNIRYDLEEFYNPNRKQQYSFRYRTIEERDQKLQKLKDDLVNTTLSTRKGVCEGYAQTFSKVCTLLNIENEVIEGYIRQSANAINNPLSQPNHSWNAVKIDNQWIFIDATWAAGYEMNGKWIRKLNPYYYNIPAKNYFKTHLPEKSIWRLRVGNIEKEDFYSQPIYNPLFLNSTVELISPTTGVVSKNNSGSIVIKLKNVQPSQFILVGFLGNPMAQKPTTSTQDGITSVSIAPPKGARQLFLLIDTKVVLEFLIN